MEAEMLFAQIRGIVAMAVIATVFGFWQNNLLAAFSMFMLLVFFEKLFRVLANRVERLEAAMCDLPVIVKSTLSTTEDVDED